MSRNTWNIYTWTNSAWVSDSTIYRPNETIEDSVRSTHIKVPLANGSEARVIPETESLKEPITMRWLNLDFDDGLKTKIKAYIDAYTKVKIVTHESEDYIGYFTYIRRIWLSGVETTEDIEINFDRTE